MTFKDANEQMMKAFEEYAEATKKVQKTEYAYQSRYAQLFLQSGLGTMGLKEQEVKKILDEEGLAKDQLDAQYEVRRAYYKLQTFTEYCKNLRSINMQESFGGGA